MCEFSYEDTAERFTIVVSKRCKNAEWIPVYKAACASEFQNNCCQWTDSIVTAVHDLIKLMEANSLSLKERTVYEELLKHYKH